MNHVGHQFIVFNTSSSDPVLGKLLGFLGLEKGWHYGSGGAPSLGTVLNAMSGLKEIQAFEPRKLDAFPAANGRILVAGYFEDKGCAEIYCNLDGTYDAILEKNGEELSAIEDRSLAEIHEFLGSEMCRIKNSFDLSIQSILMPNVAGTLAQRSKILETMEESPLFAQNALLQPANQYAHTSTNSILWG